MSLWAFAASIVAAVTAYLVFSGFLATYRKYRGVRVVTCPENKETVAVKVDAMRAAHWAAVSGEPTVRLNSCTRWPEKKDCGQECLLQIHGGAEPCLLQGIVTSWYSGKHCVYCNHEIGEIVWHEQPPALRAPDGSTVEWKDVAPEKLPAYLEDHEPVCWRCHVTESFRREHGDLVIERQRLVPQEPPLQPTEYSVY